MSDEIIILKNSSTPGKSPRTKDLQFGELAINPNSGTLFTRRKNKSIDEIVSINSDTLASNKIQTTQSDQVLELDVQFRQVKNVALERHTKIKLVNLPNNDTCISLTVLINNLGDYAVAWDNSIKWENGQAPNIEAFAWSVFEFLIVDNLHIFGFLKATNMKEAQ